jgi:endonuclease/exonuclease/phosphatase family metal-dependent hydrolase
MTSTMKDADNCRYSTLLFSLLFLFFIQQLTMLVETIYEQNLIDKKIGLNILWFSCFLSPIVLFWKNRRIEFHAYKLIWLFLLIQGFIPWFPSSLRIAGTSLGVALFLVFHILILSGKLWQKADLTIGITMAVLTSICLRAIGSTLDISLCGNTAIIGGLLVLFASWLLWRLRVQIREEDDVDDRGVISSRGNLYFFVTGIFSVFALIYFFVASPGVLSRWTGANYFAINIIISSSIALVTIFLISEGLIRKFKRWHLVLWNILFCFTLIYDIKFNMIYLLESPDSNPLIVYRSNLWSDWITYSMLMLSPILFINFLIFKQRIIGKSWYSLAGPALFSACTLLILITILIFTNIWGYVQPIGQIFRHSFYLPFLIVSIGMLAPYWFLKFPMKSYVNPHLNRKHLAIISAIFCCLIIVGIVSTQSTPSKEFSKKGQLILMTYNLQQGVDGLGNRSYQEQLAVIKNINPDVLCLQECDVTKISGGNNDIVRYFSDRLNYYSYYGPKSVTGTFGTAILSRFPVSNCRSIFTYGDKDEIGTAVCNISINEGSVLVINNHPAGSDHSHQSHMDMLKKLIYENDSIIAMGDFNFTQNSSFYKQMNSNLNDSWIEIYPDGIGDYSSGDHNSEFKVQNPKNGRLLSNNRLDMSERIDHIFVSRNFKVTRASYLRIPESASDHPVHWVVVENANM